MLSFANSFANYPNQQLSQRSSSGVQNMSTAYAAEMSLDALYLHELHHMEVME